MSIVDEVTIRVKAGNGGKGCKSFYVDPFTRKRHPDGGDGGKGGDVVIKVNPSLWDLRALKFQKFYRAECGKHGSSNKKKGKDGKNIYIMVPSGTVVKDADTGLLMKDLVAQEELVVAHGGKGGRGNAYTKAEPLPPQEGEEKVIFLELKLIADVGIIGLPNVGKTTLINVLCGTKAKVADYPFTTLSPHIGTVAIGERLIKFADIPGLIADAHKGKGLGDKFLRHIERTLLLLYLLDLSPQVKFKPVDAYYLLKRELKIYNPKLLKKPYLIVANKIDIKGADKTLEELKKDIKDDLIVISALKKEGLDNLLNAIIKKLKNEKDCN